MIPKTMKEIKFGELGLQVVDGGEMLKVSVSDTNNRNEVLETYLTLNQVLELSKEVQRTASKMLVRGK